MCIYIYFIIAWVLAILDMIFPSWTEFRVDVEGLGGLIILHFLEGLRFFEGEQDLERFNFFVLLESGLARLFATEGSSNFVFESQCLIDFVGFLDDSFDWIVHSKPSDFSKLGIDLHSSLMSW